MTLDELEVLADRLENDEEKRLIKLLMEKTFPEMVEYFEGKVEKLRQDLLSEKRLEVEEKEIVIGIWNKDQANVMQDGLYPMRWKDLESGTTINEDGEMLFPIFIRADEKDIALNCGKQFRGIMSVLEKQYEVSVSIRKDDSYQKIVNTLRESFSLSGHYWRPVNDAFLEKFYFFVVRMPQDSEIRMDDNVTLEVVDFKLDILGKMIPIWNIAHITMQAVDFPVIQENKLRYQYEFHVEDSAELILDHRTGVQGEVVKRGNSFVCIMEGNDRKDFSFWKLGKFDWDEQMRENLLTNGLSESSVVLRGMRNRVHSPFELERVIRQLSVSRLLDFCGYKVRPSDYYLHCADAFDLVEPKQEDYLIEQGEGGAYLEIAFENHGIPQYLFRHVLRFVAEVVQMEFREYRVVAVPVVK